MELPEPVCDLADDFEAWVISTRLAQGLPPRVKDPIVIARIAELIRESLLDCDSDEPSDR